MNKRTGTEFHGVVVVDKPAGMTSHDVVHQARRLFRTKRIGHTGTLDPDATGVLVLCLGKATRLAEYLSAAYKRYRAEIVFGFETDTQDASGRVLAERDASALTEVALRALLPRFRGTIQQIPPMVSALHHEGKRLYELAREGITVERAAREVQIDCLELTVFVPGTHPTATVEVTCSTGTYIRTLAADLGDAAGTGAMMRSLRRTWVGKDAQNAFSLAEAVTLDDLRVREAAGTLGEVVQPLSSALRGWTQLPLTETQVLRIQRGQSLAFDEMAGNIAAPSKQNLLALLDTRGEVCAVAQTTGDRIQPVKVFTQDESV